MDQKTIYKLHKSFREFTLMKKNVYPTDKEINDQVKKFKDEMINNQHNELYKKYIKEMLLINELIISKEFRESIFNNKFTINKKLKCKLDLTFAEDDINMFDINDDELLKNTYTRFNWSYNCEQCRSKTSDTLTPIDNIQGFQRTFDYSICQQCYDQNNNIVDLNLNKNMINIIKTYLNPIYTLKLHGSGEEYPYTSTLFDWISFLVLDLEEDSINWLINSNPNSKYYGYIILYGHQGEFEIVNHISQFSQLNFFIPYIEQHRENLQL